MNLNLSGKPSSTRPRSEKSIQAEKRAEARRLAARAEATKVLDDINERAALVRKRYMKKFKNYDELPLGS